jgi:hypothetical protein
MNTQLFDFINKYTGEPGVGNTDLNKGQCVGLVSVWMDVLGIAHEWGNAKDLLANADSSKFDIIFNDPKDLNQFPLPGAILVWDDTWGNGDGHTGVVVKADGSSVDAFEQNNPAGHAPETVHHNSYAGVLGWLQPKQVSAADETLPVKKFDFENMRTKCDAFDPMAAAGYKSLGDIDAKVKALNESVQNEKKNTQDVEKELADSKIFASEQLESLRKVALDDSNLGKRNVELGQENNDLLAAIQGHYKLLDARDEQSFIKAVKALKAPHEELVKQVVPTMEQLASAAIYKRAPSVKSFLQKLQVFLGRFK